MIYNYGNGEITNVTNISFEDAKKHHFEIWQEDENIIESFGDEALKNCKSFFEELLDSSIDWTDVLNLSKF